MTYFKCQIKKRIDSILLSLLLLKTVDLSLKHLTFGDDLQRLQMKACVRALPFQYNLLCF